MFLKYKNKLIEKDNGVPNYKPKYFFYKNKTVKILFQ
jgi:hypothetical protein